MRSLALALTLALTACLPQQQPNQPEEPPLHDSEAPIILQETGSLLPVEQALPTGVLEIGNKNAPVTLMIFTEHHCDYCREFHREQLPLLLADYVKVNNLRIQMAPLILEKYENSRTTAKNTFCASLQGKGLQMHNALFTGSTFEEVELDEDAFEDCLHAEETEALIDEQQAWMKGMGVEHVPTFFLNGEKFLGLPYYADLRGRIDAALDRQ